MNASEIKIGMLVKFTNSTDVWRVDALFLDRDRPAVGGRRWVASRKAFTKTHYTRYMPIDCIEPAALPEVTP